MDKTHHGPVAALFLCNLRRFFSYVRGVLVTNHFSLLSINMYILAVQLIKHTSDICDTLFDLYRSSELPQMRWNHIHNNRRKLKQPQSHFY